MPGSAGMRRTIAAQDVLQRRLWSLAGQALDDAPIASAPRLYVDSLNAMIDQQTVRIAALNNRVPGTVLLLEVVAAAVALGLLALYLSLLSRGPVAVLRRRRARGDAAVRDVRPRPPDPRPGHRSGHAAHLPEGVDGAAARRGMSWGDQVVRR